MEAIGLALGASAATASTVGMMAVGTAVSTVGMLSSASNAADASRYNAAMAQRNATIAGQNAEIARQQAAADAEKQRRDATRKLGAMKAGYANSGIAMEGTPLDVLGASAQMAELDTLNTIYNGELRARSFANEAQGYRDTAALDRKRASNQETQGLYNAGSSLLLGAGRISGMSGTTSSGYQITDWSYE